ncbi:MAG: ArsR family transcriptional regulator [Gammaproteobacteria bacterium]|nr:ArsR family transcriptional regulator [Gammaproteobacteria bacterium]HBW83152.1 ArsR family transcriptional regulator [Gammaproteobacteria bacterium]
MEGSDLDQLAMLYKALADQLRLQILRLLRNESFGVLELCRILDIKQSALSHHLKILATVEVVTTRREGNSIFYRRNFLRDEDHCREIKATLFEQIDQLGLPPEQEKKIKQIQLERSQLSLNFFNKNAEKFREKQGLVVEHSDYHKTLLSVIDGLGLQQDASVLEVGPGEGQLLAQLAGKFSGITALDNSNDMLERSRQAIKRIGTEGVQFMLGDTAIARKERVRIDLIVFDMVLHHISSPARTFRDCAELLRERGFLLVVELSPHDQDWVRDTCGDLWLGFEENDLNHWALKAKLKIGQSSFLSLRNGFQIQIRVFQKDTHGA